ncbi:MAG: hypothetical protein KJZ69_11670 [Phycisphaerales bacterium]|nr:hypothetical protein [Phycisphaerales bacterium]
MRKTHESATAVVATLTRVTRLASASWRLLVDRYSYVNVEPSGMTIVALRIVLRPATAFSQV